MLPIQDTTELNLESHRKRITDREGLGEAGNGTDLGFFCHPAIVVNPRDGGLMGAADIYLTAGEREKDENGEFKKKYKNRSREVGIEEKEETIAAGEDGIEWRLYTSHDVKTREDAEKITGYYRKRWIIKDVLRTLKTEGINYEESE